jgi:flagellum-specific peptidoglycan hydrolase FlgJ
MHSPSKPWWQQVTALVSLSAGGAITGLSFVPRPAADLKSPSSVPVHLLALKKPAQPAATDDATLRSAIVNVANYYLRIAAGQSPAEMEALIWQRDSVDGVDHGESCAAFASLTLELAAQAVGQQSWVSGGSSYPWPLHEWADVRVDPNPASPGIISVRQDAEAHSRWHPLGDGYDPMPGDWVLFNGHVEVVTRYASGILYTIGGDSLPNFSINAHEYSGPLGAQGVVGFVNNGRLTASTSASTTTTSSPGQASAGQQPGAQADQGQSAVPGAPATASASASASAQPAVAAPRGAAAIPGAPAVTSAAPSVPAPRPSDDQRPARQHPGAAQTAAGAAAIPGMPSAPPQVSRAEQASAAQPPSTAQSSSAGPAAPPATPSSRARPSTPATPPHDTSSRPAFISQIAPGAVATQQKYGVPASVTIAQAIEESGWGRSALATMDHNLFGIKGTGPAGSDPRPTQEYEDGQPVARVALFRVYHNVAESIDDHGKLLATSGYYRQAMADRQDPNAFANALTGVYATDPDYGPKLIALMRQYNLYRYDVVVPATRPHAAAPAASTPAPAASAAATPAPAPSAAPTPTSAPSATATPTAATSAPATPTPATSAAATPGGATIPGMPAAAAATPPAAASPRATSGPATRSDVHRPPSKATTSIRTMSAVHLPTPTSRQTHRTAARRKTDQYQPHIPPAVSNAFTTMARVRLVRAEPLYRDVVSNNGIRWELLAACDWMQCEAQARYSPVHGEKLGTPNPNGTVYRTKSEALAQCADDLAELAWAVYAIDLTGRDDLSVRDLANAFAAFRWGGLLRLHHTSAMEFPYSVAGLTDQHTHMRWPNIDEPNTPDKPGRRFRMPFGAVPVVLGLNYPATV